MAATAQRSKSLGATSGTRSGGGGSRPPTTSATRATALASPVPTAAAAAFLRKKPAVGGAGAALTYLPDERAFHSRDMPRAAREAKVEVRKGLHDAARADAWHASVSIPTVFDRTALSHFAFDRTEFAYNFRAEALPPATQVKRDVFGRIVGLAPRDGHFHRTAELPVHGALGGKVAWDAATTYTPGERAAGAAALATAARTTATAKSRALLAGKPYKTPYEGEVEFMEELRRTRSLLAAGRAAAAVAADDASKKLGGGGGAPADDDDDAAERAARAASSLSAAMDALDVAVKLGRPQQDHGSSKLVRRYRHEGVYGSLPSGDVAWSCCGAFDASARGCIATVVDPDRRCYASLR